jgi:hypothetical protein
MGEDGITIPAYNFENEMYDENGSDMRHSKNTTMSNIRGHSGST